MEQYRVGLGFDIHRLVEGRKLILGGVEIPFNKGLLGHSDGDVLTHAIADSMLGALCLGDLGTYFPDSNPRFENFPSFYFLSEVYKKVRDKNYIVGNIDAVVILEQPLLLPYIPTIRRNLARTLETYTQNISVKTKTHEGLGEIGQGLAIQAQAITLLEYSS